MIKYQFIYLLYAIILHLEAEGSVPMAPPSLSPCSSNTLPRLVFMTQDDQPQSDPTILLSFPVPLILSNFILTFYARIKTKNPCIS